MNNQQGQTAGSIVFGEQTIETSREIINKGIANQTLAAAQQKALEAIMGKTS